MATRSNIAYKTPEGKIRSVYAHWDGYPARNGETAVLEKLLTFWVGQFHEGEGRPQKNLEVYCELIAAWAQTGAAEQNDYTNKFYAQMVAGELWATQGHGGTESEYTQMHKLVCSAMFVKEWDSCSDRAESEAERAPVPPTAQQMKQLHEMKDRALRVWLSDHGVK